VSTCIASHAEPMNRVTVDDLRCLVALLDNFDFLDIRWSQAAIPGPPAVRRSHLGMLDGA
jgi:hypothetical protein